MASRTVCLGPTVAPPHALRLWEGFLIHAPGRISFFLSMASRTPPLRWRLVRCLRLVKQREAESDAPSEVPVQLRADRLHHHTDYPIL